MKEELEKKPVAQRTIKVLVIEDDTFIAMVYEDLLSDVTNITFDLKLCTTLAAGKLEAEKGGYDVLLLDLNLPDSQFANTVAQIPHFSNSMPVVVLTSTVDDVLALKTMNMGGQDYLNKSKLDRTVFIRSVLYAVERHQLNRQLQTEKEKSDSLLRNILPETIAAELKIAGTTQARSYANVSVMFVDFASFTSISASLNPQELVAELHACFSAFDAIIGKYQLEKIKTIGDAYMCAGGIPNENDKHLENMLFAAADILEFVEKRYSEKAAAGKEYWRARIGIHVGPVVAGVVGSKKFTYDIWGDTVNTASRVESNSEVGKINISESVFKGVQALDAFTFEYRGKIEAKGKGRIDMYFAKKK
jgi:class 3 adenylate cyclase